MTAIFAMQAYWLYNQYEYSSTVKAEELKQACTKALEEEKDIRLDKPRGRQRRQQLRKNADCAED